MAEKIVQEHHVWGEPTDIDILAVGKIESNPVKTKTRKQTNNTTIDGHQKSQHPKT